MKEHWYKTRIASTQIDSYGHLNNAAYMSLLEQARWSWFKDAGYPKDNLHIEGVGPIVLDAHLEFRREIQDGETLEILSRLTQKRSRVFYVYHEILNENSELCCRANYELGFFDVKTRKLVRPNPKWQEFLERSIYGSI